MAGRDPSRPAPAESAWWMLWYQVVFDLFRGIGALGRELRQSRGRWLVLSLPMGWLLVFFLVPFLILLRISLAEPVPDGIPPYAPLASFSDGVLQLSLSFKHYLQLLGDPLYKDAYANSLGFATVSTLACLLIGYPMAYGIARATPATRLVLLVLVILPFWTSSLLRTYALIGIMKTNGLASQLLMWLGVVDQPVGILHSDIAVVIGIAYNYLPFMVLPLTATLMRLDFTLLEAAADLGARPLRAFWRITLPLSLPGIVAGSLLVFIPAIGEFVIPDLLGGPGDQTIGHALWTEFFQVRDWPLTAALAISMLLLIVVPMLVFESINAREAKPADDAGAARGPSP